MFIDVYKYYVLCDTLGGHMVGHVRHIKQAGRKLLKRHYQILYVQEDFINFK